MILNRLRILNVLYLCILLLNLGLVNYNVHSQNLAQRETALKQIYQNDQWIDESKLTFIYGPSNQLDAVEHHEWRNNSWENDITITYGYNTDNQLEERKETLIPSDEVLASELYEYDEEGRLIQISFPDVPWYQGRGIFGARTVGTQELLDPYLLVSHMNNLRYIYNDFGLMTNIEYNIKSDYLQNSISFFPANTPNRPHPMSPSMLTPDDYADSVKTIEPVSIYNNVSIMGNYSYITNGNQLSVIYTHPSHLRYQEHHRYWDLYDIWYPNEMRTIWIYSASVDSHFISTPQIGHINPQKEIQPFKDLLSFWITRLYEEDRVLIPINFFGRYDGIDWAHYTAKTEKSLSLNNYYIPGNFYDHFYEPRFQGSYPLQDRQVIKIIEQYKLRFTKLNSPLIYGISWELQDEWINYLEKRYVYDTSGHLEKNILRRWEWDRANNTDPFSGQWENDSQYTFQYDESGNCDQITCSIWDTEDQAWEPLFRITYTYSEVSNGDSQQDPNPIQLSNYPNPFNTSTHVQFLLPEPAEVSLKVYDITGKWIQTILSEQPLTGQHHTIEWNGKNSEGETVPSGMYLFQLEVGDQKIVEKCLYVK